jgi:hypothetical protein
MQLVPIPQQGFPALAKVLGVEIGVRHELQ